MKKRVIFIVIGAFILCLALALCLHALAPDPIYAHFQEKEATLIVQGQELDADGAYVYDGFEFRYPDNAFIPVPMIYPTSYAKLPMIATLTALGISVEWQDEHTATLRYEEKSLILDLEAKTVTEPGKDDTWVYAVAGHCVRVKERAGQELIVDKASMNEVLFYFFGNQTPTFTLSDRENATITVTVQKLDK